MQGFSVHDNLWTCIYPLYVITYMYMYCTCALCTVHVPYVCLPALIFFGGVSDYVCTV